MFNKPPRYRSYLLTIWEERSQNPTSPEIWRFSLKDPRSGQRRGYPTLEALMAALQAEVDGEGNEGK